MEGLFGYPETEGSETPMRSKKQIVDQRQSILLEIQNSLTEPSMVESTPMITALQLKNHKNLQIQQKKKLSRIALDNNFSPIVFKVCTIDYISDGSGTRNPGFVFLKVSWRNRFMTS